jgi:hypothetical protein
LITPNRQIDIPWDIIVSVAVVMAIAGVFIIGVLAAIQFIFGEDYKFNMTQEMKDEGNVVALCYQNDIQIDFIKQFCSTRYGGIESEFGEAIK